VHPATCANCDAPLTGPYCAQCGQHAHESARSLGALFHDAWHVLTHTDGRFWQTLAALLVRPGRLTQEYFAEHRARYLPPVRLYLVLSVLFFALAALGPPGDSGSVLVRRSTDPAVAADINVAWGGLEQAAATDPAVAAKIAAARRKIDEARKQRNQGATVSGRCDGLEVSPKWLEAPLRSACERTVADGGKSLKHAFVANVPKMMFVFLPLMALVMLPLYWRPHRYYVEHLVFFLHTHAALFLILLLLQPLSWLAAVLPALDTPAGFARLAALIYAAWYVYRALRVYYGQGRSRTLVKLAVVGFAYVVFLSITLAATLVVSALTA
jgi:hypothetical protein